MGVERGLEKGDVQRVVLLSVDAKVFDLVQRDRLVLRNLLARRFVALHGEGNIYNKAAAEAASASALSDLDWDGRGGG